MKKAMTMGIPGLSAQTQHATSENSTSIMPAHGAG